MKKIFLKRKSIWLLSFIPLCLFAGIMVFLYINYLNSIYAPLSLPTQVRLPFDANWLLQEINPSNIKNLQKLHVFSQPGDAAVLKLSFSVDGCCILAIHNDGLLEKWQVRPEKRVTQYQLGGINPRAANFSADGSRLVTPRQILDNGNILGATVWNPATGKSVFCEGSRSECPDSHSWDAEKGFLLDPSGKWLLGYGLLKDDYGGQMPTYDIQTIDDPSAPSLAGSILLDNDLYGHDPNTDIALVASDINTQYFVFALSNGLIHIRPINNNGPSNSFNYTDGLKKTRVNVVDLAIDDTRTWVAELCDDQLLVWNAQHWIRPLAIRIPVPKGTALAFDHTGQILAVATSDEIRFYDLNWRTVISHIPQGAYAIFFSSDNRSLLTGDADGSIHMWGIPNPNAAK